MNMGRDVIAAMKPIRCIECYRKRPGGRCDFCPLHRKNRHKYQPLKDGWYLLKEEKKDLSSDHLSSRESPPSQKKKEHIISGKNHQ